MKTSTSWRPTLRKFIPFICRRSRTDKLSSDIPKTWMLLFEGANQGKLLTKVNQ
jgi:hypothetical protein